MGIEDTGSQVLIRYTLVGDANMDGLVNEDDLGMMQSTGTVWTQGDFNYDGKVDADDFSLFMLGEATSAALGHPVPEPAGMGVCIGLMVISFRRTKVGRF